MQQLLKNDEEYKDDIDYIRDGYNEKIDELRRIAYHSDELLLQYQQELAQAAGIPNVKVKYVLNQGYFLEVTNKDISKFESEISEKLAEKSDKYHKDDISDSSGISSDLSADKRAQFTITRKNTLKGGQRYSSPYLENLQGKILEAKDVLSKMEREFLDQAKTKIAKGTKELHEFTERISWLDVLVSQAILAHEKKFTKPLFVKNDVLQIIEGRHPVIEEFLPRDQQFIPNDLQLHGKMETLKDGKMEDD